MKDAWQDAKKGEVHERVFAKVREVERLQSDIFERFVRLASLYDPDSSTGGSQAQVTENLIASNIDTVYAAIAATEIRPRLLTDDGDWSTQRTARHLSWYAEGLQKLLKIHEACCDAFKLGGALKGTGAVKVYTDAFSRIRVEPTMVDDIVVDELETRGGNPRQMHQRMLVDRDVLKASWPDSALNIERAQTGGDAMWRMWADYRPIEHNQIVCIESWCLPIGDDPEHEQYKAGRHTITIDGHDILDEEWHKPFFPFAIFRWSKKTTGWYGIGLAQRIAGHQRVVNKMNWQFDRNLDQFAVPTTYVRLPDANIAVKSVGRLGTVGVVKADYPMTITPQAVTPEAYARQERVGAKSFEESGVSRMSAQSMKPAGLDSGAALREYRDATTQRFSPQEKGFEQLELDTVWLALDCAKDLGADAPTIVRKAKHGPKRIPWSKVDMGEVRVQLCAASSLSKTPAGRTAFIMEMAQGGVISQDMARRLLMPNSPLDVERELSLYTAALENIERCLEAMLDGEQVVPEPYQNLKMCVWRGQMTLMKAEDDGAPEDVLENLRQFTVQAAWMQSQAEAPDQALSAGQPSPTDSTMPLDAMPPDPTAATMAGGPPMAPDMGPTMTGAGVAPAQLLQ